MLPDGAWRAWWVRLPGFFVACAALNRAEWLWRTEAPAVRLSAWSHPFAVIFGVVAAMNLVWHASAPWRHQSGAPWVALATLAAYGSYALTIWVDLGGDAVRATAVDLMALALVIAWSWGPDRERID